MQKLNFPDYSFRFKNSENKVSVFDEIRKKFIVLTPEEWVRQHVIGYLVHVKNIPSGSISVEKALTYHQRLKRWDIATFDDEGNPSMLIECKQPKVACSAEVLVQISAYQKIFQAKKLVITNGLRCHVYQGGDWKEGIEEI